MQCSLDSAYSFSTIIVVSLTLDKYLRFNP